MASEYKTCNYDQLPSDLTEPFTITCPAGTDMWRKPGSPDGGKATDDANCPVIYRELPSTTSRSSTTGILSFRTLKVTVTADWKDQYDQGGLCIVVNPEGKEVNTGGPEKLGENLDQGRRWVKTGIEFFNGTPRVSTVTTDRWSDWSLAALPEGATSARIEISNGLTIPNGDGSLWVYLLDPNTGERILPLREVNWWKDLARTYQGTDEGGNSKLNCWVGVYAAKPKKEKTDEVVVNFQDLEIDLV